MRYVWHRGNMRNRRVTTKEGFNVLRKYGSDSSEKFFEFHWCMAEGFDRDRRRRYPAVSSKAHEQHCPAKRGAIVRFLWNSLSHDRSSKWWWYLRILFSKKKSKEDGKLLILNLFIHFFIIIMIFLLIYFLLILPYTLCRSIA